MTGARCGEFLRLYEGRDAVFADIVLDGAAYSVKVDTGFGGDMRVPGLETLAVPVRVERTALHTVSGVTNEINDVFLMTMHTATMQARPMVVAKPRSSAQVGILTLGALERLAAGRVLFLDFGIRCVAFVSSRPKASPLAWRRRDGVVEVKIGVSGRSWWAVLDSGCSLPCVIPGEPGDGAVEAADYVGARERFCVSQGSVQLGHRTLGCLIYEGAVTKACIGLPLLKQLGIYLDAAGLWIK
uniref:Uncharacterized protein n=1 Tax=viral metagenome TaxID=1070528 RepID=A0A6C0KDY9_9ZZZZ